MAVTVYNRIHNASGSGSHPQLVRSLMRILEDADLSGELILTNRKLKEYPKGAAKYNLADTVIADLSRNRFCELPEQITAFAFLETLILYHNTIRTITPAVKSLTSLTYLDLRSNQLSTLPRELCFLPLQVLLVSNNRLVSLPDELGRLDKLTDLDASYNQLTTLPARIGDLRNLRSFSIRSNQLMYLPRELTYLTLVSLDVSNNRISSLPVEMRQMITLVDINLENNPLISPPASLCVRGLVHVFKFLETQATKDERGKSGSNYDGSTTLRRAPRHTAANSILEQTKPPLRNQSEFGYNTCDGIDKRWSHDMPHGKAKSEKSLISQKPFTVDTFRLELSSALQQKCHEKNAKDTYEPNKLQMQKDDNIIYAHSNSNSSSSPDEDVLIENQKGDDKNKNLENVQTYREYKESLKQQRNQDIYKLKGQKMNHDSNDSNVNSSNNQNEDFDNRLNGSANGVCAAINTKVKNVSVADDIMVISKKPIQKVIPSRNTDVGDGKSNGDCTGGYVKPSSPMKSTNGILSNNNTVGLNKFSPSTKQVSNIKSPGNKSPRTVTWNHDIPPEKLSFTMRREFDKHREEIELLKQLRSIIETRLKMTLPEDIALALTDGVILCHLANYVRPRSVASIHVPSPGVSKLTMARCRRNVDNFLEACRKIGVDEELICSSLDVIPNEDRQTEDISIPNPSAVYRTVVALINIASEQQQQQRQQQQQLEKQDKPQQTDALLTPATKPQTTDMWDNNHCSKDQIDYGDSIEYKFSVNNNHSFEIGNGDGNCHTTIISKSNLNKSEGNDDGLHYENEKIKNSTSVADAKTNNNNITASTILKVNDLNSPISNKFKLLEIPNNVDINNENHNPKKIVTKRIEFFEDQKHSIPTISMSSSLSLSLATKPNQNNKDKQPAILRHDSTALTIMLSLIFIVSLVIIIFFPLPS